MHFFTKPSTSAGIYETDPGSSGGACEKGSSTSPLHNTVLLPLRILKRQDCSDAFP